MAGILQTLIASYPSRNPVWDGIVSYYKLNSNSNDSLGTNNGTDTNVSYVTGKIGNAGSYNGTSSVTTITNSSSQNITNDISIFVWIKANAQSATYCPFIEKHYAQSYYFGYGNAKKLSFFYGGTEITSTSDQIVEGTWQHIGVTYNRSSQTGKFYVNGTNVQTFTAFNPTVTGGTTSVLLGKQQTASRWYNGLLDELGIWNRTLSDSDATTLYNSGSGITY